MEIVGRLTADAVVKTLPDERQVTNFTVAINKRFKAKNSDEVKTATTYVQCAYWVNPKRAKVLTKGTLVQVQGDIGANAWVGSDGEARVNITMHVNDFDLHSGGSHRSNTSQQAAPASAATMNNQSDDLPF